MCCTTLPWVPKMNIAVVKGYSSYRLWRYDIIILWRISIFINSCVALCHENRNFRHLTYSPDRPPSFAPVCATLCALCYRPQMCASSSSLR